MTFKERLEIRCIFAKLIFIKSNFTEAFYAILDVYLLEVNIIKISKSVK